jgi:hypothetical protein
MVGRSDSRLPPWIEPDPLLPATQAYQEIVEPPEKTFGQLATTPHTLPTQLAAFGDNLL